MSGIANSTGAKSGIIGTTVGTPAGGGLQSQQVFTTVEAGTWTKPAGITTVKVYVTGGGGGGGATDNDDQSPGGGAGATAIKIIDVTSIASVTATVGGGHEGIANSGGTDEIAGNNSTFAASSGDVIGGGGYTSAGGWAIAGKGGTATGGDINIYGGDGQGGSIDVTGHDHLAAGTGGASFWGQGGRGNSRYYTLGRDGRAFGSGGGGGADTEGGNDGADGIIVVEEYS